MSRRDYFNDPAAPRPNSIVPAASAVVTDDDGRILLQRRTDSGSWSLPGGAMELGETLRQTVIREVYEETGLTVEPTRLVGVYSDPRFVVAFSDGEVRQQFSLCFACRILSGEIRVSSESTEVRFVSPSDLEGLDIQASIRVRLRHFLKNGTEPVIE
ncbi:MAG: NUDIX domain-containing protein [Candidatus Dormibacteria bacterium]